MAASYPTSVKTFTPKVNVVDLVQADDPNSLFNEVTAIESVIGTSPSLATAASTSGWANTATDYTTINGRLANIEKGVVADTHTQYAKIAGGSTVIPSTISTVGLIVKATSGQTANLQQWQTSAGVSTTYIDSSGALYSNGFPVTGLDYTPIFFLGGL